MHVLVYGAGAVGGYFGARLARGGHDVTLVARGANLDALQRDGLTVHVGDDTWRLPLRAVASPADASPADLILVCVKAHGTRDAAEAIRPAVGAETIVLSLQNGVENEGLLADALGLPPLMVGLTRIGVELTAPGVVHYTGRGEIVFGEPDGSDSPRALRLAQAFRDAALDHRLHHGILVAAWEKLAWNAGFNAVTTLADVPVGPALAQPGSRRLVLETMRETDAVATAMGIPVRRGRLEAVLAESVAEMPDFPTSMLQDRRRGARLEWDALNGAVVRAGDRVGVPVPLNRAFVALLSRVSAS
jgi:2-dehydropantoate 2-reductase